jgi:hypothetical protein
MDTTMEDVRAERLMPKKPKIKATWYPQHRWAELLPSKKRVIARKRGSAETNRNGATDDRMEAH